MLSLSNIFLTVKQVLKKTLFSVLRFSDNMDKFDFRFGRKKYDNLIVKHFGHLRLTCKQFGSNLVAWFGANDYFLCQAFVITWANSTFVLAVKNMTIELLFFVHVLNYYETVWTRHVFWTINLVIRISLKRNSIVFIIFSVKNCPVLQ